MHLAPNGNRIEMDGQQQKSAFESAVPLRRDRPLIAIAFKIFSVMSLVIMSSFIKLAGKVALGQVVFFRSFFAFVLIVCYLAWRGQVAGSLYTRRPMGHLIRGIVGVLATFTAFYALMALPLPEAVTLGYAQPLLIVIFSTLFLHQIVERYRWITIIVGFLGIVIISWPKLTMLSNGQALEMKQALGVAAALASAALTAVALLLVRDLVRTEKSSSIIIWFSLMMTGLSMATIPFGWTALTTQQFLLLIGCGLCGGIAQLCMTESYRYAEAATVAPFEYTSMVFAIFFGYVLLSEVPTFHMIVGGLIIVSAGLYSALMDSKKLRK